MLQMLGMPADAGDAGNAGDACTTKKSALQEKPRCLGCWGCPGMLGMPAPQKTHFRLSMLGMLGVLGMPTPQERHTAGKMHIRNQFLHGTIKNPFRQSSIGGKRNKTSLSHSGIHPWYSSNLEGLTGMLERANKTFNEDRVCNLVSPGVA